MAFPFVISSFVPEIFKFSFYAHFVTDDVTGCTSTVVRHQIKNISANNEAMRLKFGRDVAPYKMYMYQMVHILILQWQHPRFHSPSPSKSNITICHSTGQNTWSYLRHIPDPPSTGSPFKHF